MRIPSRPCLAIQLIICNYLWMSGGLQKNKRAGSKTSFYSAVKSGKEQNSVTSELYATSPTKR